ncbi:MAG: phytanoyl-CoA dioxygenase family protein, partial [Candidatus Poribacteria bacterium]|nr:phytanoyl-CoA dioxygenase family protein [Candidatus Poribacteria bacterium]
RDKLDILRERMTEDSVKLIANQKWGGAGHITGHLQQGAPPIPPFVFREIVSNPFAIQVSKGVLSNSVFNSFYNGNTNTPGSKKQPLHRDKYHLWDDLGVAHPATSLVINISPLDTTVENGAVELWPRSHLDVTTGRRISEEDEEKRRAVDPPIRGCAKKGSLLIRDMRVWHRGVPNESDEIRHMIALVHNIGFLRRGKPLVYAKGCEDALADSGIDQHAVFTDEPFDYLVFNAP